jgi:hypothetical protein
VPLNSGSTSTAKASPACSSTADRAWYYKSNAGNGQLAPPLVLRTLPSPSSLAGGVQQLQDLGGDGQMDLVAYGEPLTGYATRTPDGDFDPLRTFTALPTIDWHDPNLRFVDVDGDGLADVLISQDDAFVWYRSLAKDGFEDAQRIVHSRDEDKGAAVVFADAEQSIQLADMTGDGLVDIVRVRNGEVCYWPNLGYGRFGAKVTRSPVFAGLEDFDARRIRFGDVDCSGTSDVFYLGTTGVTLYTYDPDRLQPRDRGRGALQLGRHEPDHAWKIDEQGGGEANNAWLAEAEEVMQRRQSGHA